MTQERIVIREKTWKHWVLGGSMIAPGADRFWKLHGYTRRRRVVFYSVVMGLMLVAVSAVWVSVKLVDFAEFKAKLGLPWVFWMLAPGIVTYVVLRVLILPLHLLGALIAARTRRAKGRLCWECGSEVGEGSEGRCACGETWNELALRQFWIACGLLPATQRELRAARFAVGGESGEANGATKHGETTRGFAVARVFTPLPRDQMTAWQERPMTQGLVRSAMRLSAALSLLVFFGLALATLLLSRTLMNGSLGTFVGGMIVLGAATIIAQVALIRWSLSRTVRTIRERVREANGLICTDCGFALRGLDDADRCPECGIEFRAQELRGFFRASGILDDGASPGDPNRLGATSDPLSAGREKTK